MRQVVAASLARGAGRKKCVALNLDGAARIGATEESRTSAATMMACEVMHVLNKLNNAEREHAAANAWRATIYVRNRRVGDSFDDA